MDNCLDCIFCNKIMFEGSTRHKKSIQSIECRRYPPQLVEADKWVPGYERSFKEGKEVKSLFPVIPLEKNYCGSDKITIFWCGEFKKK